MHCMISAFTFTNFTPPLPLPTTFRIYRHYSGLYIPFSSRIILQTFKNKTSRCQIHLYQYSYQCHKKHRLLLSPKLSPNSH